MSAKESRIFARRLTNIAAFTSGLARIWRIHDFIYKGYYYIARFNGTRGLLCEATPPYACTIPARNDSLNASRCVHVQWIMQSYIFSCVSIRNDVQKNISPIVENIQSRKCSRLHAMCSLVLNLLIHIWNLSMSVWKTYIYILRKILDILWYYKTL